MPPAAPFAALLADAGTRIDTRAVLSAPVTCADEWVGAWATCAVCGTLCPGRVCGDCALRAELVTYGDDRRAAREVAQGINATCRPRAVVVAEEGAHVDHRDAVIRVPVDLRPVERLVLEEVAARATALLDAGAPLSCAVRHIALGRDQLSAGLMARGHDIDRDEVRYALRCFEDLDLLTRTGQMRAHMDPETGQWKSGAILYALNVELPTVGHTALIHLYLLSSSATAWGNKSATRIEGCLKWALKSAREGMRNAVGYWLTRRCLDVGLFEDDAQALLRRYAAGVDQTGSRYTAREAAATVRSAYRRHG